MRNRIAMALAATGLLIGMLAPAPAQASTECSVSGPGSTQSCTIKLAGARLTFSGGAFFYATQPSMSVTVTVNSVTTGVEIARCERTQTYTSVLYCLDHLGSQIVQIPLPPSESLACAVTATPAGAVESAVYCRSGGA